MSVLPKNLRTLMSERWIEHRPLAYVLARITIVCLICYAFFGIGGLWGFASAIALFGLGVMLALRARRW
jgi:hypothetical protein